MSTEPDLPPSCGQSNRPVFFVRGLDPRVSILDGHSANPVPLGQLALNGPSTQVEPGHLPVRGDLAHIALAGLYFVPHYAAPMPHRAKADGAVLHCAPEHGSQAVSILASGEGFDVLDINGAWAWGQVGTGGLVGYIAIAELEVTEEQ